MIQVVNRFLDFVGNRFWLLLLLNSMFFVALAFLLPMRFEENDDIAMCMIASGAYSGSPDAHLVFINYLYGLFLVALYNITTSVEWYTISFCIINIISLSVIIHSVLRSYSNTLLKIAIAAIFYIIEIRLILLLQFTTTAAIASLAGFILFMEKKRSSQIAGIALLLIGSLIRFDAFGLVVLLSVIMFLLKEDFSLARYKKKITLFAIVLVSLFGLKLLDRFIYSSNEKWAYFMDYNEIRGRINDNPNAWRMHDSFSLEGVEKNDFQLLLRFFSDGTVIDKDKIESVGNLVGTVPFGEKIKNVFSLWIYYNHLSLIVLLILLIIIAETKLKNRVLLLLYLVLFVVLLAIVSLQGTLKSRVFLSALLPCLYIVGLFIKQLNKQGIYSSIAVLLIFLVGHFSETIKVRFNRHNGRIAYEEQISLINNYGLTNKEISIISFPADIGVEYINPFKIHKESGNLILNSGWLTHIPINNLSNNSYQCLLNGKNVLFVNANSYETYIPKIVKSIEDNYNQHVTTEIVAETNNFKIVQFHQIN